ncbi:keratin, type II cytoskeletal 2 epidermal-like [Rhipicephalus sanguineus]|uniref:keratin, type II cytoskeletal 2 epidermal-like n=1 Tax=Rhipicephalus sanguineus TaxID=34632 RepID=UPI001893F6EA|nr:keratin, type II cytoskeletal 2 epidermal-like [Rhipicephalus sanguineus]
MTATRKAVAALILALVSASAMAQFDGFEGGFRFGGGPDSREYRDYDRDYGYGGERGFGGDYGFNRGRDFGFGGGFGRY